MKQITAVIKPFKLEEVREALAECGVTGLTVTGAYRSERKTEDFPPTRCEFTVETDDVARGSFGPFLPVVAETWDGLLNDIDAFHVTAEHAVAAIEAAAGGPVAEGNVGGGTGMICHGFKGGIGTASRVAATASGPFTVGALVQANYGARADLRVDGVPVGRLIAPAELPLPAAAPGPASSIIVILATDAPLLPIQCRRLARRATVGLARVGGFGHNGSGDIFLAFATGNHLPAAAAGPCPLLMLPHPQLDPLFYAAAEATEEAILNALCAAETMVGRSGNTAHRLPHARLRDIMEKHSYDH